MVSTQGCALWHVWFGESMSFGGFRLFGSGERRTCRSRIGRLFQLAFCGTFRIFLVFLSRWTSLCLWTLNGWACSFNSLIEKREQQVFQADYKKLGALCSFENLIRGCRWHVARVSLSERPNTSQFGSHQQSKREKRKNKMSLAGWRGIAVLHKSSSGSLCVFFCHCLHSCHLQLIGSAFRGHVVSGEALCLFRARWEGSSWLKSCSELAEHFGKAWQFLADFRGLHFLFHLLCSSDLPYGEGKIPEYFSGENRAWKMAFMSRESLCLVERRNWTFSSVLNRSVPVLVPNLPFWV